ARLLEAVLSPGRLPARFPLLADGVPERLPAAFAQHPWVARVDGVELAPPRTVRVRLAYRQPALAVEVTPDLAGAVTSPVPLRAADEQGILLPKRASIPDDLPVLRHAPRPTGPAGQP